MRFVVPVLIGVVGVAVLASLGIWQVQRLAWKEGILADIAARIVAEPQAIPAKPDPVADRYLPVRVTGVVEPRELHVLVSTKEQGAGFRIITALEAEDGRRVLLDRGFVLDENKTNARPAGDASITGNLHWPQERDGYTPEDDIVGNFWFARDVDKMAALLKTEPILVVARSSAPEVPGLSPLPVDTAGIPNDHLGYAVTWFGLALVWAGMTAALLWRMARRTA